MSVRSTVLRLVLSATTLLPWLVSAQAPPGAPAPADNNGFQTDGSVSDAVWQLQSSLMKATNCSIPTQVFSNADGKHGAKSFDTNKFHDSLTSTLGLTEDTKAPVTRYDGFVTRLFDTPSSNNVYGSVGDDALLGIVQSNTDPHAMLMWGVGAATVKYDCNSVLKLATSVDASYSYLSLTSLQTSFTATKNGTAQSSLVIVTGRAQSLFDVYRSGNDPDPTLAKEKEIFADLQGIFWQEGPLASTKLASNDRRLKYITDANIISYASTSQLDSSLSLAASLAASVTPISFVNAKGTLATNLTESYQQMNSAFTTYIYHANSSTVPPITSLVADLQAVISLGNITQSVTTFSGGSLQFTGSVHGWPSKLCNSAQWLGAVNDPDHFSFNSVTLQSENVLDSAGFNVCDFTFSVKALSKTPAGSYDPGLTVKYKTDDNVAIQLPLGSAKVTVVTTPTFTFEQALPIDATLPSTPNINASVPLLWKANGALILADNYIPTKYSVVGNPDMPCVFTDGSKQSVTVSLQKVYSDTTITANVTNPTLSLTNPDRHQTLAFGVILPDSSTFNTYAPLSQFSKCTLSGPMQITINNQDTNTSSTVSVNLSIAIPFPPNRQPMAVKGMTCVPSLDSKSELSLTTGGDGEKCTITGNDLDMANAVNLQIGAQQYRFPLTYGVNSGTASFSLGGADVKKFAAGSSIQVAPTDSAGTVGTTTVNVPVVN